MTEIAFDGKRAYELLKRLAVPRLGGTEDEKKAAELLRKDLRSFGLDSWEETFKVQTYEDIHASVEVLEPYRKKYVASVVGNTGSTPEGGVKGQMVHLTTSAPAQVEKAGGRVVLAYNAIPKEAYQQLIRRKTRALVMVADPTPGIRHGKRGDHQIKAFGRIPTVYVSYEDALEMVHKGAKVVSVVCRQREFVGTSRNVVATIKGTQLPNERIIVVAHYDSVNRCPGAIDNGGGAVSIAEFARHFAANPPRRSMTFIWCGSEELGLKGSWAYAARHAKELARPKLPVTMGTEHVRLVINFDLAGVAFGNNGSVICGSDSMAGFVESFAKERGLPFSIQHAAYSSDNIPFNEAGIPSIAINRYSGIHGHSTVDKVELCSAEGLEVMGQFGLEMTSRIANATEIPFELSIPPADQKATWEYVERANPFYERRTT